jgi:hypothetical protein
MLHFIVRDGNIQGPWSLDEITERFAAGEFTATDHVYMEAKDEWVSLMDWTELREEMRKRTSKVKMPSMKTAMAQTASPSDSKASPKAAKASAVTKVTNTDENKAESNDISLLNSVNESSTVQTISQSNSKSNGISSQSLDTPEWVAMTHGGDEFKDLSTKAVIKLLQSRKLFEFDMIRHKSTTEWTRIAGNEQFGRDAVRRLVQAEAKLPFSQRKYTRVPYYTEAFISDSSNIFEGKTYEGGEGGSGLVIQNSQFLPGQNLTIHFMGNMSAKTPAFNAECEIVSKSFIPGIKDARSPVQYGVRFLKLDSRIEKQVTEYFRNKGEQWIRS